MSYINNGNIANCIAILKKSILTKKKYCSIPYTKPNIFFIHFLYKNGFIELYQTKKNINNIEVKFKIYQDKYVLHSITNFFRPGNLNYLNVKRISQLKQQKNIQTMYILWTSFGFITLSQAFYRKVGGILVCKLN